MKNPWYFVPRTQVGKRVKKYQLFKLDTFELKRVINHNFSVVQMNSNFIELTNKNYVWKGKNLIFLFLLAIPYVLLVLFGSYFILKDGVEDEKIIIYSSAILLAFGGLYVFITMLIPFLKFDFLKPLYLPVLISRHNNSMTVCSTGNSTTQFSLDDLYFDIVQSQGVVGLPLYELHAYILDGEVIKHDIQLGTPNIHKDYIEGFLLFIKTYIEQGPESLYYRKEIDDPEQDYKSKLTYCYDIQEKKESFKQSWQTVFINHFQTPLYALIFAVPEFLRFFGRRITVVFSKPFYWSETLKKEHVVDENDPYSVTAKDNLKFGFFSVKEKQHE
ncbi:hypothetical protein [Acinetobacter bereziniae]|uniref:hypothetical protein n=2 Tax=Acinetobacter bereziniae TaxID=106648 RepID=UPI0018FF9362|nr:hypothetical protein [Acinetobacter bereziniae]MBJ9903495.1 hypothetical protein [Acinetobacter bereziniae]MCU4319470.1 hypothetical protein [Acinetobacter bereziniae]MCU4599237.1 hypothetical protein [Acinetobacter bereziniae]